MKYDVYTYTNKGGRTENEDSLQFFVNNEEGVFILADGLGGHKNGKIASKTATNEMLESLKLINVMNTEAFRNAFISTNEIILNNQMDYPQYRQMKTTCVALHICNEMAMWGHVGDSRLYYFSGGELLTMTQDHSVTYKKYLGGDISYKDIRNDEDRASLLGVLGNQNKCVPEISEIHLLKKGDAFLLCSDGFWEYVFDEEMLIDLLKSETPNEWAKFMLIRYIQRIHPSNDNISLIAIFIN